MEIMRGTQVPFRFQLFSHGSATPLTSADVTDVEVVIGKNLRKTYTGNQITYDTSDPQNIRWQFTITQSESYGLSVGRYPMYVRIKYTGTNGWIDGKMFAELTVNASGTEVTL